MTDTHQETIFALATPPGSGGIGVIRVSGPDAETLARALSGKVLRDRQAQFCAFRSADGQIIDRGIALLFKAPRSFTGEDVLELQVHGGGVIVQLLSRRLAALGARAARPGEFSERAFLNDKLDLTQAEAIADLISAGTEAAARAAQRSLDGALSRRVAGISEALIELRVFVEAALDFPDEEIDFIAQSDVLEQLTALESALESLLNEAKQGQILRDGMTIAIVGQPNAGKSSLLNALTGREAAIVTAVPGTTRDVLHETLSLNGLPVHIADTAGLREASDPVEVEGIRRARNVLATTDLVLLVIDLSSALDAQLNLLKELSDGCKVIAVLNKTDLNPVNAASIEGLPESSVCISALTGQGLDQLIDEICTLAGLKGSFDGAFSARTRHLDALRRTSVHIRKGREQLTLLHSGETLAEELRLAQRELGEITGQYLPDDLLGAIFSSFCIGK